GYSLNDTIIVFDRIRENSRKYHRQPYEIIINRSINETLSRTLLTSLTTLMVVIALFVLGGGIIHDFAFALIIGIIVGTYSSIYVASPVLIAWQPATKSPKGKRKNKSR
ncbi:MAG: protein translocase subunit SecF, partial [Deltaproteobacteria bacterium]|nr:protein translocase subunit SecF [Deltaproteobacteria bacterium]